jgi:Protein of unknown function (DUF3300)
MKRLCALGIGVGALAVTGMSMAPVVSTAPRAWSEPQAAKTSAMAPNPDDLDRLLAPIALYPDALLAQMLLCAAKPAKVAALNEWMAANPTLKGSDLQDAATKSGFDQSFAALVLFPDVVNTMASQIEWTTRLGEAFAADRSSVFASIQRLRKKASQAGKLKSSAQQDVATKTTSSGEQVIVIEPANPQVVYVPQYNPQTVYVPSTSSTVVIQQEDNTAEAVAAGLIGFTAGIALGAAIDNNYYYGPYGWHGGGYMYNDAWDDWYDDREDARDDWQDHREDMLDERGDRREDIADERGDRAGNAQQQRTDRQQTAQQQRTERQQANPEAQAQREQRRSDASGTASQTRSTGGASMESRGYTSSDKANRERSGTKSDAFSGYSNGKSERAASSRGQKSRSSSRSGGRRR